jgi:hypothetical protein
MIEIARKEQMSRVSEEMELTGWCLQTGTQSMSAWPQLFWRHKVTVLVPINCDSAAVCSIPAHLCSQNNISLTYIYWRVTSRGDGQLFYNYVYFFINFFVLLRNFFYYTLSGEFVRASTPQPKPSPE